jgi:dipeptidyl aminopeptidase/acylaminoacyl peptidase
MRVGAYGWSVGGQLAALLGTRDTRDATAPLASYPSRVACVVDLAGDVDLAAYTQPPALHEVVALLGGTPQEVPERYRDASPLSWIDGRTAPFLVVHGTQDDVVPIEQSRRLVAALRGRSRGAVRGACRHRPRRPGMGSGRPVHPLLP